MYKIIQQNKAESMSHRSEDHSYESNECHRHLFFFSVLRYQARCSNVNYNAHKQKRSLPSDAE